MLVYKSIITHAVILSMLMHIYERTQLLFITSLYVSIIVMIFFCPDIVSFFLASLTPFLPSPISVINKTIEEDRFDIPDVPMEED